MSVNLISITKYKNDNIPYFAVFMTVVEDSTIHGSFLVTGLILLFLAST